MNYFAYGSNMYSRRLAERISSCRFHPVALLPEHRLAFHMLEGVSCVRDPRPERERRNRRLLEGDG